MTATRTFSPKPTDIERRWYVVDADGAVLGRLASEVAKVLRGKHKPIFAPHADTGDHVIVVNARGVRLTGGKENKKIYYRHSGYPGGLTEVGYARLLAERPVLAVEKAVRGMLPKNRLGRQVLRKLAVYEGPEHPHQAQQPAPLALGEVPRWDGLPTPKPAAPTSATAKKSTAKKSTATKSTAKKSTAKKSTAKKSTAKKSTARKSTATKAGAAKSSAKKSTAKTATAKRSTARRATGKSAEAGGSTGRRGSRSKGSRKSDEKE